jgi:hypothetical protein
LKSAKGFESYRADTVGRTDGRTETITISHRRTRRGDKKEQGAAEKEQGGKFGHLGKILQKVVKSLNCMSCMALIDILGITIFHYDKKKSQNSKFQKIFTKFVFSFPKGQQGEPKRRRVKHPAISL